MAETRPQQMPPLNPNEIVDVPVDQLLLDPENPRLAWSIDGDSQDDLVKILWTEMAVDEVAWSIAENGFFRSEPLFVIIKNPEEKDGEKRRYIVNDVTGYLTLANSPLSLCIPKGALCVIDFSPWT